MTTFTIIAYLFDLPGTKFIIQTKKDEEENYYFVLPPDYQIDKSYKIDKTIVNSAILKHSYVPFGKVIETENISQLLKDLSKKLENNYLRP